MNYYLFFSFLNFSVFCIYIYIYFFAGGGEGARVSELLLQRIQTLLKKNIKYLFYFYVVFF